MKFTQYFIADQYGLGLKYIQGARYWNAPLNIAEVLDFTSFDTEKGAREFCAEKHIDFVSIQKYTVKVKK